MTPRQEPGRGRSASWHSAIVWTLRVLGSGIAVAGVVVLARPPKPVAAQTTDVTFAEDVAPILYKHCTMCHRPDGVGPFPMFEYDSAKA